MVDPAAAELAGEDEEVEPVEAPVEAPVRITAQTLARNPVAIVIALLALLGGGTGGLSLLQGQTFDRQDCQEMITAAAEKADTARRRESDLRYAKAVDVVAISTKLDTLLEAVQEIKVELRESRRSQRRTE